MTETIDEKEKNYHMGHRARMKQRYLEHGLDSMADHEVLEMLLFFALPYKDTNGLAHELLNKFGSLSNVLEADSYALQSVKGIGANASLLLNFIPKLAGRYYQDRWRELPTLADGDDLLEYIKTLFVGRSLETFFMLCMNAKGQMKSCIKLAEGTVGEVVVYTPQVVESALQQKCSYVIFAHNHPGGNTKPSRADVEMTRSCYNALNMVGIKLIDHIIVCGTNVVSMSKKNLIKLK